MKHWVGGGRVVLDHPLFREARHDSNHAPRRTDMNDPKQPQDNKGPKAPPQGGGLSPTPVSTPTRPAAETAVQTVDRRKLKKFRLMPGVGKHEAYDYSKEPTVTTDGREVYPSKIFEAGDVVLSLTDLTKTLVNKFERVHEDSTRVKQAYSPHALAVQQAGELEKLSESKLRQIAEEEEIDVSGCKTREDLAETIQSALLPQEGDKATPRTKSK